MRTRLDTKNVTIIGKSCSFRLGEDNGAPTKPFASNSIFYSSLEKTGNGSVNVLELESVVLVGNIKKLKDFRSQGFTVQSLGQQALIPLQ